MHFLIVSHSLGESECFNESIQLQKAVMEDAQGFICILVMVWNEQLVCCQGTHSYTLGRLVLLSSSHQKLTVTWQNYSRISDFYQTSPCMINVCLRLYVYDLVFQFILGGGGDCRQLVFLLFCSSESLLFGRYSVIIVSEILVFCMAFRVVLITTMVRNFRSSLWVE